MESQISENIYRPGTATVLTDKSELLWRLKFCFLCADKIAATGSCSVTINNFKSCQKPLCDNHKVRTSEYVTCAVCVFKLQQAIADRKRKSKWGCVIVTLICMLSVGIVVLKLFG